MRASVGESVRPSTHSNIDISQPSRKVAIKFYLKYQLGGEKPALGFELVRIGTLASMATDRSNRVIMGKMLSPLQRLHF